MKLRIYLEMIDAVVLLGYETGSLTLYDETKFRVLKPIYWGIQGEDGGDVGKNIITKYLSYLAENER